MEITFEEFQKIEMRVGTILKAEKFNTRKPAIKLEIDFGELGVKKSSAQITELYKPEELIGRQVIAVMNFPPKQIADLLSEVLVLGIVQGEEVILLTGERKAINGARIA